MSATDIVPLIEFECGLPLTVYDQMILHRHEEIPVFLATGLCLDKSGNILEYDSSLVNEAFDVLEQYLYAEYNLLKKGSNYRSEIFAFY